MLGFWMISICKSCDNIILSVSGVLYYTEDSDLKFPYSCQSGSTCNYKWLIWERSSQNDIVYLHDFTISNRTGPYPEWTDKVSGSWTAGEHKLNVKKVEWEDEGRWACRIYLISNCHRFREMEVEINGNIEANYLPQLKQ